MKAAVVVTADNYEWVIENLTHQVELEAIRAEANKSRARKARNMYDNLKDKTDGIVLDKYILSNRLVLSEIKRKEQKRYLEAYQKLYVREALDNAKSKRKENG